MPFKSEAQRRFMFANHPKIAAEFEAETPKGVRLPKYVPGSPAGKTRHKITGLLKKAFK